MSAVLHVLLRKAGLGDVLMLLPVARALRRRGDGAVLATGADVAAVFAGRDGLDFAEVLTVEAIPAFVQAQGALGREVRVHDLGSPEYSLQPGHQIAAFMTALGLEGEADLSIRLPRDERATTMVEYYLEEFPPREEFRGRVLLHPASGAIHRTWARDRWQDLAARLEAADYQVFVIGSRSAVAQKGAFLLDMDPTQDLADKFGFWENVELMRRSDCLVSTDSAPIQMAGATDIGIVGLYSIVRGAWRLPHRDGAGARAVAVEPSCARFPCYPDMLDPALFDEARRRFEAMGLSLNTLLYEWCSNGYTYDCLRREITVEQVFEAVQEVVGNKAG